MEITIYIYRQGHDPQTLQLSRCFLIHLANSSLSRCENNPIQREMGKERVKVAEN
jgi:hypothetical protein